MTLNGQNIHAALASIGAVGGQMTSLDNIAAGANDALRRAPAGLTVAGAAGFLATMAQESAFFRATEEYAKNGRYAPYIGRTFEMITWKGNYAAFGAWCKQQGLISDADYFVKNPKALADYKYAWDGGVWFFGHNGLWKYANAGNFLAVSQGVNGGNGTIGSGWKPAGWNERQRMYNSFHALGAALLPASAPRTTRFPLPSGQWYGPDDHTTRSHSGVRGGADKANVIRIQKKAGAGADGIYGAITASKVKVFQRAHKLAADGLVGPKTWSAMGL